MLTEKERREQQVEVTYNLIALQAKSIEIAADKHDQLAVVSAAITAIKLVGHLEKMGEWGNG